MKRLFPNLMLFGALVLCEGGLRGATASAAPQGDRNQAAARMVEDALRSEIAGLDAERHKLLQSALEQSPGCAPARWHSGYVQQQNKWLSFEELPGLCAQDGRLAAYRRAREQYPETVAGQMQLADWCAKRKLADQQRAHLTRVLDLDPDNVKARGLLGYRRVDGRWVSEQEIAQLSARAKQSAAALRQWRPKLLEIRNGLAQKSPRQREMAAERLRAIDDPAAIEPMELLLAGENQQAAMLVVVKLEQMTAPEAALALSRVAVFSRWQPVREAAAQALKTKDVQTYAPALLSALSTPVQSRAELYTAPSGRLTYRHTFFREGQDRNELAVFETEYRRNVLSGDVALARALLEEARLRDAATKARQREMAAAQQNAAIGVFNRRICEVLSAATGQYVSDSPEAWWKWWSDYNEVFTVGGKPTNRVYLREEVAFSDPYMPPTGSGGGSGGSTPGTGLTFECLVAGTPVWTDAGAVAVERIQAGDRVLSQDPDSGELAYKPVLRTTQRPPAALMKIDLGDQQIQCSGGHPFWICGEGWTKARFLKPGSPLHSVTGTRSIQAVEEAGNAATYNLIVADFHTYFCGKARVLTHDNTIRKATAAVVPGLVDR